jgi:hypothetical protein
VTTVKTEYETPLTADQLSYFNAMRTEAAVSAVLRLYEANWPADLTAWQRFLARVFGFLRIAYRDPPFPETVTVVWTPSPMTSHPGVTGLFVAPHTVRVRPYQRIHHTALAHELMHMCLLARRGTTDPDHLGAYYKGWTQAHGDLVLRADALLKVRGL